MGYLRSCLLWKKLVHSTCAVFGGHGEWNSQVPAPEKALPFSVRSASYWTTRSMLQTSLPQLSSGTHFSLQHKTCVPVSQGGASTTPTVPEAGSGIVAKQTLAQVSDNFPEVSLHRISENAFVSSSMAHFNLRQNDTGSGGCPIRCCLTVAFNLLISRPATQNLYREPYRVLP